MTEAFIFISKLLFAAILLAATIISTVVISPVLLVCWILGLQKAK